MWRHARTTDPDPPPRRWRAVGAGDHFADDASAGRLAWRAPGLSDDDRRAFDAVVDQFEDVIVKAGCIRAGKVRPDRSYVWCYLARQFLGIPPARLAREMGVGYEWARFAIRRGRALFDEGRRDGRLARALARAEAEAEGASGSVNPA